MASNFPDGNRQSDWELFPREEYDYDEDYDSRTADEQVEYIDDYPDQYSAAPPFINTHPKALDENGNLIWSSAATTPTQTPQSFLSSFFGQTPTTTAQTTMTATTPNRQGLSPSSSPRLPSPPPYTEVQIGPKSPSIGDGNEHDLSGAAPDEDNSSLRRIRPGTKAAEMASGPPLVPLGELDSPFQLQEHLKALYQTYTKSSENTTTPITRDTAMILAAPPEGVDRQLWLYELCRFLTMKANNLIIAFFAENPPCSGETCPEMRASEWQYLCAVHEPPKSCCAIDYCCHTLDWATNVLTSPKYFPSRLTLGSEAAGGAQTSMRYLTNIFRRVYRIFAHAWFQHRGVFWLVEGNDGLYVFFKTVCDAYGLIGEDNYTIPAEAEGHEVALETPVSVTGPDLSILKKNSAINNAPNGPDASALNLPEQEPTTISTGATTRRHKHTPSTGTNVTMIAEAEDEEEDHAPRTADDETTEAPQEEQEEDLHRTSTITQETEKEAPSQSEHTFIEPGEKAHEEAVVEPKSKDEDQGPGPSVEGEETSTEPSEPTEPQATTQEELEEKVSNPVQEGSHNLADIETREETEAPSEGAAT